MTLLWTLALMVAAYLIGSLSFAVIVSRLMGLDDPRAYGSGNPGATNVLRSGNKKAAALTLLFDALKGLVPVALVGAFGDRLGLGPDATDNAAALVGLAAFLGHLWPVFFGFKGGKGVATAAGVLLGFHPLLGLITLLLWLLVAYTTRYSSLAALIAAGLAPLIQVIGWDPSLATLALAVMSALLIARHRANIDKLLRGQESRIGQKAAPTPPDTTPARKARKK
ncbi:acyl-phosphate glycerol-3-phosphate acyltransferase [Sphaerotilus hippei]|uniref:Glycerol-3-phosphate acyltransferase n=1 Tax=Sphaerotilus hippei TaxID=744406 RepID=A0A318GZC4_9BURK|nr:glycerol-3-phosphate 1-O-acyltransferase PlsY [Sphaerotilus hippei]PXW94998.1 acyl-phosphate glycerol-3-phosphate acyltransferase [Sphaerotilus hippei]